MTAQEARQGDPPAISDSDMCPFANVLLKATLNATQSKIPFRIEAALTADSFRDHPQRNNEICFSGIRAQ